ncbi:hypothetical protein [Amycolatopsis sp. NPDC051903]|uniref:hypothetical protein n=1 Tax=Amycolatopsis sp. NPDC051903 TaxID=3363936 RepID=UPI0037B98007
MLEAVSPGAVAAVVSGLLGLATIGVRVWGRVALARHQRRAMTAAVESSVAGAAVRAGQWTRENGWFVDVAPAQATAVRLDRRNGGLRER